MALERWIAARELHARALRNRSQASWHQLRIGLKRLRYAVESFLPGHHARWGNDLKRLQDLLGEVHDLDVLWATLQKAGFLADAATRDQVYQMIERARDERIAAYRETMIGEHSLWQVWRDGLPSGERLDRASMAVARTWAGYRDPAPQWTGRIAQLSLHLMDAFAKRRMDEAYIGSDTRSLLAVATAMHAVGKGTEPPGHVRPGHHKSAAKRIAGMTPPLGWDAKRLRLIAFIVRYHRGALPKSVHPTVRQLPRSERRIGMFLAGILRLAEAIESLSDESLPRVEIEHSQGRVSLRVSGYDPLGPQSPEVASATYMIETACAVPVLVRGM